MKSFNDAFNEFLSAWRSHQELRTGHASFDEILISKDRLDALRLQLVEARRAL